MQYPLRHVLFYLLYSSGHVAIWELNFDKREASQVKRTFFLRKRYSSLISLVPWPGLCLNLIYAGIFSGFSVACQTLLYLSVYLDFLYFLCLYIAGQENR